MYTSQKQLHQTSLHQFTSLRTKNMESAVPMLENKIELNKRSAFLNSITDKSETPQDMPAGPMSNSRINYHTFGAKK
jgi:hypothetical protein